MVIGLTCQFAGIGVVSVGGNPRVVDHCRLEVEATISEIEDEIDACFR